MEPFDPIQSWGLSLEPKVEQAFAFASANIALVKYWGKRDSLLNLPTHSSVSLSLGPLGTHVKLSCREGVEDRLWINDRLVDPDQSEFKKVHTFLNPWRSKGMGFEIASRNTLPTAAGLASSASAFASLSLALDQLFGWNLKPEQLSIVARLGSGSASRSIYTGFALWNAGVKGDGSDSFAHSLGVSWPSLRWAIVLVDSGPKEVSSRVAMERCAQSCSWFNQWPEICKRDLELAMQALSERSLTHLGQVMEHSALTMHATMLSAQPPICYWQPQTIAAIKKVQAMRRSGVEAYFTIDAGANVKVLYEASQHSAVKSELEQLSHEVLFANPWSLA